MKNLSKFKLIAAIGLSLALFSNEGCNTKDIGLSFDKNQYEEQQIKNYLIGTDWKLEKSVYEEYDCGSNVLIESNTSSNDQITKVFYHDYMRHFHALNNHTSNYLSDWELIKVNNHPSALFLIDYESPYTDAYIVEIDDENLVLLSTSGDNCNNDTYYNFYTYFKR